MTANPFVHEAHIFGHGDAIGVPSSELGWSASISDTVVVGAYQESVPPGGVAAGAAYVFVRSGTTWTEQQRLIAPDGETFDNFGYSVSIHGDTVVVGSYLHDAPLAPHAGAAYVFVRSGTTWTVQQELRADDAFGNDWFGASVAVYGDTIVVGAPRDDTTAGLDAGSLYVFARSGSTWTQQQHLLAADGAANNELGYSVSLYADTVVAGAQIGNVGGQQAGSAYVFVRSGTTWSQQQKLYASDGALGDSFGTSVSVNVDTVIVGAPDDDTSGGFNAGSAYVFVRSGATWSQQQKLTASDGADSDFFGWSVSVFGDTAVVGAFNADTPGMSAGAAYVFVRGGTAWAQHQKLVASDGASPHQFGHAVSISGDTLVVGAFQDVAPSGASAGSAYVFFRAGTTWTEQQKLMASDRMWSDSFGVSVSVSGDTLVVGAHLDDTARGLDAGSVYVFVRSGSGWAEQQKVVPLDGAPNDQFGFTVSLSGDTVVIGAPAVDVAAGANAGSAYVFARSGTAWTQQQKLLASDGAAGDLFGGSVSISLDTVVVGARSADSPGADAGAAYVFVRSGQSWTEQQKLTASDASPDDQFGTSVSIDTDTVVVGAARDDNGGGADAGSAYVYARSGTAWSEQQKILAADGAAGDEFGHSVSAVQDTAVVGSPLDDTTAGTDAGSAYVFVRSGSSWAQQQKMLASDAGPFDDFGWSVALSSERVVVGADHDFNVGGANAGAAYVFSRAGSTWTQRQKLLAPDAAPLDEFGYSVSTSGDTVAAGAIGDDTPSGPDVGSVHVFRAIADLAVAKSDGTTTAVPGQALTYTIVVSNAGPSDVDEATVTDVMPGALVGPTWTCVATAGSSCTASGSGNISDIVSLLVGGTATYTVTGTVAPGATGTLVNTATVTAPSGVTDPNPANNSATDTDTLTPETDLAITKTDSADPVNPGDPLSYSLAVINDGPSDATGVTITDTLPAGVTFVSSVPGPPTCSFTGGTVSCGLGAMVAGAGSSVTINVTVNPGANGMLVNTATVSGSETDPDTSNNTASAATAIGRRDGELSHGTDEVYDLAALPGPVADEDVFRIDQAPNSSYEVVIDATSGDIGAGNGPILERLAPDGMTVIQTSVAIGAGPSRSLRWINNSPFEVEGETIRVRSAGCTTDCGPDDVYRIRAYETTYSVARFNNTGSQVTVLILQNPTDQIMGGVAHLRDASGVVVCNLVFGVTGHSTVVFNTTGCPGANGIAGSMTVANTMRYGEISGKAVALEPATGFSFDSPLVPRMR